VFADINSNRTMFEVLACANEMAQRIAYDTRDWTALRRQHVLAGATVTDPAGDYPQDVFPLPPDYKRMLLTANLWRTGMTHTPMKFIDDHDEWLRRSLTSEEDSRGEWTLFGNDVHMAPGMGPGTGATFMYLSKNCISLAGGGVSDRFQNDGDTFRLDERLLKLGMTYDWKMKKGSPYAEDMGTYSDAIANAMGRDKPAPIYIGGRGVPDVWGGYNAQY
jgi:hypothetical protein